MSGRFFSMACFVLALVLGAYAWRHWIEKPTIRTTVRWYEKRVEIPAKTETRPGRDARPSPEIAKRDTLWLTAPCDSVRVLASRLSQPFTTIFEDTLAINDSLISFSAREITKVDCDPWTRLITKTRHFEDAILKAARVETTETTSTINWLVTLAAFIAGLLLAIFST